MDEREQQPYDEQDALWNGVAGPASELERYVSSVGPVGRVFSAMDAEARHTIVATVLPAFEPYMRDGEVRFTAACWMVEGTTGAREEDAHA